MSSEVSFAGDGLHIHVTGTVAASLTPWWIQWLRTTSPELAISCSVTQTAENFVTLRALQAITSGLVWRDVWHEEGIPPGVHVGEIPRVDGLVVFPCSLDTAMRLATGRTDSPALMLMQLTETPIVLAHTFPGSNEIIDWQLSKLHERKNVRFAPSVPTIRATTREVVSSGFNLSGALELLEEMRNPTSNERTR